MEVDSLSEWKDIRGCVLAPRSFLERTGSKCEEKMPAVGGGPSPEEWERMSAVAKYIYSVLVGAAVVFIGYLVIVKLVS